MRAGPLAPIRVTLTSVQPGRLTPALFGIGTVEARRSVLVGPTLAGRVRSVRVEVGDTVQAGQWLAEMDPVDLEERRLAVEASIARAGSTLAAAQAQGRDMLARRELAAMNARRNTDLAAQNFISAGALEARLQELASAEAALGAAEANLSAAQHDLQRLAAERAGLLQQRASLRLTAPMDAVVTSRDAEPGSTVIAGQAVLRLIAPDSLWVRVRLDQARSAGLAVGLPAQIALRSQPGAALRGHVARVEAVSDSVTEERMALVAFDPLPSGVSVGDLAEVTLSLPAASDALLVPNAAIVQVQGRTGVWQLDGDALRFVALRLGQASLDGQVQVLDGLRAGDRIVVHSEKALNSHSRLQVVDSLAGPQP
ncbi:efflux RND transporter periplasmic adaptor subunit [Ideonella sp. 4Y11]|uniref:Efflux RND transporter periplasmic adaptor subunit n=2 Tax=Ideonella aquatica TaxID=2824119 RepID=A0A941BP36_9BURK|nr:efflux RND transporter periplasmic adaptor subunit [Ideonella aquatica]